MSVPVPKGFWNSNAVSICSSYSIAESGLQMPAVSLVIAACPVSRNSNKIRVVDVTHLDIAIAVVPDLGEVDTSGR